jgi:hypothetical protein
MSPDVFDLKVVDKAFGRDADLYEDVLRVSHLASDAEIQSAFFDRRSEIFAILSKLSEEESDDDEISLSQRRFAERRMDAVVMAFRILKDPALRNIYEGQRELRMAQRAKNEDSRHPPAISRTSSLDAVLDSPTGVREVDEFQGSKPFDEETPRVSRRVEKVNRGRSAVQISVESSPRRKGRKSLNTSMDTSRTHEETSDESDSQERRNDLDIEVENVTARTEETGSKRGRRRQKEKGGVIAKIQGHHIVRTITEEVHGAYLDTTSAFDQVLNAFTLQDNDINAVCGRIDKAKRQLTSK